MSESVLLVEKLDSIATLTLNRPRAMNALSRDLRAALAATFGELEADPQTAAIVLTGAGRAFCAGLDLKELAVDSVANMSDGDMIDSIRSFSGPVIGAINGHAITGGFELALACDVLIASPEARFADTHARVGVLPGWGLSQVLPRLIGIFRAKEISLTGNFVSAEKAEAWGLVNRVVPAAELLPTCTALARDMLSCDHETIASYKRLIDAGYGTTFHEAMEMEKRVSIEHSKRITADSIDQRHEPVRDRGRAQAASRRS
jgi:enoyl-CoA hydratase